MQQYHRCRPVFKCSVSQVMRMLLELICKPEFKCCVNELMQPLLQLFRFVPKLQHCSKEQLEARRRRTR